MTNLSVRSDTPLRNNSIRSTFYQHSKTHRCVFGILNVPERIQLSFRLRKQLDLFFSAALHGEVRFDLSIIITDTHMEAYIATGKPSPRGRQRDERGKS